jgi:hypothetical protein
MVITISSLVFIVFNSMLWRVPNPDSIFATRREFFVLVALGTLLVLIVQGEFELLLYPLNVVILISILALHTTLVTAFLVSLMRPVSSWRQALPLFALSALIALGYLSAIAGLRAWLLPGL